MFALCRIRGVKYFFSRQSHGIYKSQYGQDFVLEKLGLLTYNGFFVEVGANDPVTGSNSYFLEKAYRYSGISIDAIDYSTAYRTERPNTTFVNCVIDSSKQHIPFFVVSNKVGWENMMSSVHESTLETGRGFSAEKVILPAARLSDICKGIEFIDILMIDVEGHEFEVLNSFNWKDQSPKVVLIENNGHHYARSTLERYMREKGYGLRARIGSDDDIYVRL